MISFFSVRPDEVVGVYYMFLGYVINYDFNYNVDASVSVYFDVV